MLKEIKNRFYDTEKDERILSLQRQVDSLNLQISNLESNISTLHGNQREVDEIKLDRYLHKYLSDVKEIKAVVESSVDTLKFNNSQNLIVLLIDVINHSSRAYKKTQFILRGIDAKVHNEFVYLSRAQNTIFKSILLKKFDVDFELALINALTSARHILNDCVDLIVSRATQLKSDLTYKFPALTVESVFPKYYQLNEALIDADKLVCETRYVRGKYRIDEYIDFMDGKQFDLILEFCSQYDIINEKLVKQMKVVLEEESAKQKQIIIQDKQDTNARLQRRTTIFAGIAGAFLSFLFALLLYYLKTQQII